MHGQPHIRFVFCFIVLITLKIKFILNGYPVQTLTQRDAVIDYSATSMFKFKFKHFQKPQFKVCVEKVIKFFMKRK